MKIIAQNTDPDLGKRLDLFLSLKLPEFSRSFLKKIIESNKVLLNDKICFKAGYKISANDSIEIPDDMLEVPKNIEIKKSKFDLEILFEDEDYLFINKPIGLVVHPTGPHQTDTLVNKLLDLGQDWPSNNILRPGIVHRLDKDTSGVIVVAKTPKALWWLSNQFAERKVHKEYTSIGFNQDENFRYEVGEAIEFEGLIRRSSENQKRFIIEKKEISTHKGRYSKSVFKIQKIVKLPNSKNLILSKIHPLTGRTHQIRVHQREMGFPIVGDPIYMSRKEIISCTDIMNKFKIKPRLFLHASQITFENFNKKLYCISAQLPNEFDYLLNEAINDQNSHSVQNK
jgi:23S rRNA pseudouridine1911/1915/1917 synthase